MKDKLLPLIAIGFPGAYKFFVIYFLSFFATQDVTDTFSQAYFWVGFLVTFAGVPFSSIVMGKNSDISIKQLMIGITLASLLVILLGYFFKLNVYSIEHIFILFISLITMSVYEVIKTRLLNTGKFNDVVISSVITVIIFLITFSLGANKEVIILVFFLALLVPISLSFYFSGLYKASYFEENRKLCKAYFNFAISNALSTSIMAFLPLFLIAELGDNVSTKMAQVFTFSTLLYLLPRALLAKKLPTIRTSKHPEDQVIILFYHILLFVSCAITIALLVLYLLNEQNTFTYFLLFTGIIISQLNLPFSTLLVVNNNSKTTLAINFISSIYFFSMASVCFYSLEQGYNRANLILSAFILFQIIKLFLNYKKSIGFNKSQL